MCLIMIMENGSFQIGFLADITVLLQARIWFFLLPFRKWLTFTLQRFLFVAAPLDAKICIAYL